MIVIYDNIPAVGAPSVEHVLTGCENKVFFRADNWGANTQVQIESFVTADVTQKVFVEFVAAGSNINWCIPCVSEGETWRFNVLTPDPVTNELFVSIGEPGCCCPSDDDCFEIPIKFKPC